MSNLLETKNCKILKKHKKINKLSLLSVVPKTVFGAFSAAAQLNTYPYKSQQLPSRYVACYQYDKKVCIIEGPVTKTQSNTITKVGILKKMLIPCLCEKIRIVGEEYWCIYTCAGFLKSETPVFKEFKSSGLKLFKLHPLAVFKTYIFKLLINSDPVNPNGYIMEGPQMYSIGDYGTNVLRESKTSIAFQIKSSTPPFVPKGAWKKALKTHRNQILEICKNWEKKLMFKKDDMIKARLKAIIKYLRLLKHKKSSNHKS